MALETVLTRLFSTFALAQTCTFHVCLLALARQTYFCASALHIEFEDILGKGQRGPNVNQLTILLHPSMIPGVLNRHQWLVGCSPDSRLGKHSFLRCWPNMSCVGGFSPRL